MLRRKKDSMRDIPKDVRHSLEILDNLLDEFDDGKGSPVPTVRHLESVPVDVRKSLQILDSVLGEFEVPEGTGRRSSSDDNILRVTPDDIPEEVTKSLEVLDQVLDEFQNTQHTFRRKQQSQEKDGSLRIPKHEDVRRSLEVLDSVLAEFDDCLEAWDTLGTENTTYGDERREFELKDSAAITLKTNYSKTPFSYDDESIDGDTSHESELSLQEQTKIASPPPVPKRSATTKLSDRGSGLFNFQLADSQSFDSLHSEFSGTDNDLSDSLSAKDNDEVFKQNPVVDVHCCTKCGREIECITTARVQAMEKDVSSSPFSDRRKMFQNLISESSVNVSPMMERSFNGSSFKVKSEKSKDCESEPSSLVFYRSMDIDRSSDSSQSNFTSKYSPKATKVSPPRIDGLLSLPNGPYHAPNCNCKERIRELQAKFAETLRLIKANKIKRLDHKPPSFIPPPPPLEVVANNIRNENSNRQLSNGFLKNRSASRSLKDLRTAATTTNSSTTYFWSKDDSLSTSFADSGMYSQNGDSTVEQNLCKRCSISSVNLPLSETIEDLPKLLPTDTLLRPQLGLSYSMEDDLSPGVKEILQTPSPRTGVSGFSRKTKTTSLSTFSLSDSSLGYVSSQSDHELSNSPKKLDKVPVSNIKFSTLPEGMDLHSLPSYYGQDQSMQYGHKPDQPLFRDRNFNNTTDPQLRSSSAPPQPELPEKPKKGGIFRGFSRKNKKDKEKNGDLVRGKTS